MTAVVWRGGVVVRASDLREVAGSSPGRSAPRATLGKLFTHLCLCSSSSIIWYRCKLGVKLALHATHWPRVRGIAASTVVSTGTEISAALWAFVAREGLYSL